MALKDLLSPGWLKKIKAHSPPRVPAPIFVLDETMCLFPSNRFTSVMLVPRPDDQLQINISYAAPPMVPSEYIDFKYAEVFEPFIIASHPQNGLPVSITLNSALNFLADPSKLPFKNITDALSSMGKSDKSAQWQDIFSDLQATINTFEPQSFLALKSRLSSGLSDKYLRTNPPTRATLAYLLTHKDKATRERAIRWTTLHPRQFLTP